MARLTLKFDGWPQKTIRRIFYVTSTFLHHSIAISEFKVEVESGNAQFGSELAFLSHVNLTFDGWPRKLKGHLSCASSSCLHHFVGMCEFKRLQMETLSALLALCSGNSPVLGEFPAQRPVTRSFDVFFDLRLNKWLSKQSWGWWFETLSCPLWRHRNVIIVFSLYWKFLYW